MTNNLGTVKIYDSEALLSIVETIDHDMVEYFDTNATWQLADLTMGELGSDCVEVRINGLDYIFVER